MRKRLLAISAAGMLAALAANYDYAKAASAETIRSRGSFVFHDGSVVALYSADIGYLQSELDDLFGELPDNDNNDGVILTKEE